MFLDQTRAIPAEILALVQWPKVQSFESHPEVDEVDSSPSLSTSAGGFSPPSVELQL